MYLKKIYLEILYILAKACRLCSFTVEGFHMYKGTNSKQCFCTLSLLISNVRHMTSDSCHTTQNQILYQPWYKSSEKRDKKIAAFSITC